VVIESRKESMIMRRSPFGVLLLLGIGLLLGAALFGGTAAVGSVLAAPFVVLGFMFKVVLFFLLFGLMARLFAGSARRGGNWSDPRRRSWCGGNRSRWPGHPSSSEDEDDDDREDPALWAQRVDLSEADGREGDHRHIEAVEGRPALDHPIPHGAKGDWRNSAASTELDKRLGISTTMIRQHFQDPGVARHFR